MANTFLENASKGKVNTNLKNLSQLPTNQFQAIPMPTVRKNVDMMINAPQPNSQDFTDRINAVNDFSNYYLSLPNHEEVGPMERYTLASILQPAFKEVSTDFIAKNLESYTESLLGTKLSQNWRKEFADQWNVYDIQGQIADMQRMIMFSSEDNPNDEYYEKKIEELRTQAALLTKDFDKRNKIAKWTIDSAGLANQRIRQLATSFELATLFGLVETAVNGVNSASNLLKFKQASGALNGTLVAGKNGTAYLVKPVYNALGEQTTRSQLAMAVGNQLYMNTDMMKVEMGDAFQTIRDYRDEEGNRVPKSIARKWAENYGTLVLATEQSDEILDVIFSKYGISFGSIFTQIGLGRDWFKQAANLMKSNGFIQKVKNLLGLGVGVVSEAGQEGVQAAGQEALVQAAIMESNKKGYTNIDLGTIKDRSEKIWNALKTEFTDTSGSFIISKVFETTLGFTAYGAKKFIHPVSVKAKSDANAHFKPGGKIVNPFEIDTMGAVAEAPETKVDKDGKVIDEKLNAIFVDSPDVNGLQRGYSERDRKLIQWAREQGWEGIRVVEVPFSASQSAAERLANIINEDVAENFINESEQEDYTPNTDVDDIEDVDTSVNMEVPVVGTKDGDILVKNDASFEKVKEYFKNNSFTQSIITNDDGSISVRLSAGDSSVSVNVRVANEAEINGTDRKVVKVQTKADWATEMETPVSSNPFGKDEYLYSYEEYQTIKKLEDILAPQADKLKDNDIEMMGQSIRGAAKVMPIVSDVFGKPTSEILEKFVFTIDPESEKLKIRDNEGNLIDEAIAGIETTKKNGVQRYRITIGKNVRSDTLMHEIIHGLRKMATPEQLSGFAEAYGGTVGGMWLEDIKKVDGGYRLGDTVYKNEDDAKKAASKYEERFVDDFMRYLYSHEGFNDAQRTFFSKVQQFFEEFWDQMRSILSKELDASVVRAFDILFGKDTPVQERADFIEVAATEGIRTAVELANTGLEDAVERDEENGLDEEGNTLWQGYDWDKGMSNNAVAAYESGEKPLSKWSKADILSALKKETSEEVADILGELPINVLRDAVLERTSWHHTSKYYNKTNFYSLKYLEGTTPEEAREFVDLYKWHKEDLKRAEREIEEIKKAEIVHTKDGDFKTSEGEFKSSLIASTLFFVTKNEKGGKEYHEIPFNGAKYFSAQEFGVSGKILWQRAGDINSEQFINWFKGSKVVNSDGSPMVVYHGTNELFEDFEHGKASNTYANSAKNGFFFTSNRRVADSYLSSRRLERLESGEIVNIPTNPRVMEVYLHMENPLEFDVKSGEKKTWNDLFDEAKKNGHDGIIIRNIIDVKTGALSAEERQYYGDADDYIVFSNDQIRIKDNGNFAEYKVKEKRLIESPLIRETGTKSSFIYNYNANTSNVKIEPFHQKDSYRIKKETDGSISSETRRLNEETRSRSRQLNDSIFDEIINSGNELSPEYDLLQSKTYSDYDDNSILHQRMMDRNTQARIDADYEEVENALRADPSNFDSDGNHLAPNGKKSNLTYKQWVQVRTPAFMDWFGDWLNDPENASKALDENGEPMVFYHGSKTHGIEIFDSSKSSSSLKVEGLIYATPDISDAQSYAGIGGEIYPFYLNIRNPLRLDVLDSDFDEAYKEWEYKIHFTNYVQNVGLSENITEEELVNASNEYAINHVNAIHKLLDNGESPNWNIDNRFYTHLEEYGWDGVIDPILNEYAVVNSNQVKSATDNSGAFSTENESILYQLTKEDIIAPHEYYSGSNVQQIAHGIKEGDKGAIEQAAFDMAKYIDKSYTLIPIPSHSGKATTTLDLANAIAQKTGAKVSNILKGVERQSLYDMKLHGIAVYPEMLGLELVGEKPKGNFAFVDNVIATGTTATAADRILEGGKILAFAKDSTAGSILYQLSDEERKKALESRKYEIETATAGGYWVRTEYIEEFAGEDWADRELKVRHWMQDSPDDYKELKDIARRVGDYQEFKEELHKKYEDNWFDEDESFYKRIYQLAQTRTAQEKDSEFIAKNVMGDDNLLRTAKALKGYADLDFVPKPGRRSGGYYKIIGQLNRAKGVSNKVRSLSDGERGKERSTSEEIQAARELILKNPRAYRMAYEKAMLGEDRAGIIRGVEGKRFETEAVRQESNDLIMNYDLDTLDDRLEAELYSMQEEQLQAEKKANLAKAKKTDWKKTAAQLEKKLAQANADLEKLNTEKLSRQQAQKQRDEAIAERNELRKQMTELQNQLSETKAERSQFKAQRNERRKRVEELRKQLVEANRKVRTLTRILDAYERREAARNAKEVRNKLAAQIKQTLRIGKTTFGWNGNACDVKYLDAFAFLRGLFVGQDRSELIQRRSELIAGIDELKSQNADKDVINELEEELEDVRNTINGSEMKEVPAILRPFTDALHLKADNRISKYTAEELSDILTIAKALKIKAKQEFAIRYEELQREKNDNVSEYFFEIFGEDITDMKRNELREAIADIQDKEFRLGIVGEFFDKFRAWNAQTSRLTRNLDGKKEGVLYNFFTRQVRKLYEEEQRNIQFRLEMGGLKFTELGLKTTDLNKIMVLHKDGKTGYTFAKDNRQKVRLTVDQAIGVYIYGKNEDGLMKLRSASGNGITEEAYYEIIANLTPEQKAWGDWMMAELDGHWQSLADVMYDVYNLSLGKVENYFTFKSDKKLDGKDEGMDIVTGSSGDTVRYVDKGFTKERVRAIYPLDLHVSRTWENQVRKEEHFVAFAKWGRDANYYMDTDAGFGEVIEKKFGETNRSVLANYVEDVISPRSYTDEFDKTLSTVVGRGASAVVAGNISVMLKQIPTLAAAIGNVGMKEFVNAVIAPNVTLENFLKANEILYRDFDKARQFIYDNSPVMKTRKYGSELIDNASGVGRSDLDNFSAKVNSKVMKYTAGLTDSWVVSTLWLARYMTVFNEMKADAQKKGITFNADKAHEEAVFKAGQLISETQNTSVPMDISYAMRKTKTSPFMKPFYLFSSTLMNMFNQLFYDIPFYSRNHDYKGIAKVTSFVTLNMAAMLAINGTFHRKKDEDDEEYAKRIAKELASQIVSIAIPGFGGNIANSIKGWSGNNGDISLLSDTASVVGKIFNSAKSKNGWERLVDIMGALGYASTEFMGLPANATKKLIQSAFNANPGYLINKTWGEILEDK